MSRDTEPCVSEQSPGPVRLRRCWRLWAVLALLAAFVAWFSHFAYLRITLKPTPRPEYWEAKLAALDPPPPEALTLAEAADVFRLNAPWSPALSTKQIRDHDIYDFRRGPLDDDRPDIIAMGQLLSSEGFTESAARVRAVAERGWCDPSLPGLAWRRSSMSVSEWSSWLLARSRWLREHDQDSGAAVQDWLTVLKVARQSRRPRTWTALRISSSLAFEVAAEMMYAALESPGEIDTKSFAAAIDRIQGPPLTPTELLAGQRIALLAALETFYVSEGGDWMDVSLRTEFGWPVGWTNSRVWNLLSPLFHDLPTARAAVDRYVATVEEFADLASCQRPRSAWEPEFASVDLTALTGLGNYTVRRLAATIQRYYESRTDLDAAVTMLALAEYRRQQGQYPARLARLVPAFLPRLPIDCGDMGTLRYQPDNDTYVLYSIGLDGQDNGGQGVAATTSWSDAIDNHDMVFSSIRRPAMAK